MWRRFNPDGENLPMRVSGGRLVELSNSTGPVGRPREGAVADRVQLEVLRPNEDRISV